LRPDPRNLKPDAGRRGILQQVVFPKPQLSHKGLRETVRLILRHQGLPDTGIDRFTNRSDASQRSATHFPDQAAAQRSDDQSDANPRRDGLRFMITLSLEPISRPRSDRPP